MKKNILELAVLAGIVLLTACSRATPGTEIDRIMAEAREQAARERARDLWGGIQVVPDPAEGAVARSEP
jgi:hypothetical protein